MAAKQMQNAKKRAKVEFRKVEALCPKARRALLQSRTPAR
jgi:hypothetical protein